jgi:ADP-ribose pyrophosphatase YjhB (NUDIX family)
MVRRVAPTYTVGAVVLLYDRDPRTEARTGRMLLLRQPGNRGWSLPAGLLNRGEAPVAGAVRELAEETGVELAAGQLTPAVPNAVIHYDGRWVDVVFEAEVTAGNTTLRVDGAEVLEAAWYDLAALPPLSRATAQLLGYYGIGPQAESAVNPAASPAARSGRPQGG